ncbi:MAG TPA: helix-turn-helix transcriptional regulator [Bacillota bacterium]|nr:helix-turn-helix transcriptional regulator [Bacillota bacterium]
MEWFGLGKKRSKLGKWLDQHGVTQTEFSKLSGVSRPTVTRLCSEDDYSPNMSTAKKIIKAIKDLTGSKVDYDDFWM